ncbi:MAG: ParB N-terminal domain-containing protein [Candidatus Melainabacteria bacterium]|nr:ParB N-terminal domain-containing protein [Candidatus Melainabacteria bacterium]
MTANQFPLLLNRFVDECAKGNNDFQPRKIVRRFHGLPVSVWRGKVHIDDIDGWVDNIRIRHYLHRWRKDDPSRNPTTDDIYKIMVDADEEETQERKKPFHIERMASNISRNGIQEPVILFATPDGKLELWDGNRRFFGTKHIMHDPRFAQFREEAKWIPADVYSPSGDPNLDEKVKHAVLTEMNFIEKDHIPWPAYVKAEEVHEAYTKRTAHDPHDSTLRRTVKQDIAKEYGLNGWRQADRWIKMYDLAQQFKEYHEEEHNRDEVSVNLLIQDKFEYFDELSKAGVWGSLSMDPDARDEVFNWLWDGKFLAFPDVRKVPEILANPVARALANQDYGNAVKDAIARVIADDPALQKDKRAANEKIQQFAKWLDSFKRTDFKELDEESLSALETILNDVTSMLRGLQGQS